MLVPSMPTRSNHPNNQPTNAICFIGRSCGGCFWLANVHTHTQSWRFYLGKVLHMLLPLVCCSRSSSSSISFSIARTTKQTNLRRLFVCRLVFFFFSFSLRLNLGGFYFICATLCCLWHIGLHYQKNETESMCVGVCGLHFDAFDCKDFSNEDFPNNTNASTFVTWSNRRLDIKFSEVSRL